MILLSDFKYSNLLDGPYIAYIPGCFCGGLGTWGVGWIVVVLGFSQTDIPVPQFPEAQQASRSIRGNGAVLTSPTLLLRLIPYTEVKGWGLRWGKEWEGRNNVTAVPLLTSLLVLMSVFYFLSWQNCTYFYLGVKVVGGWNKNKPLLLIVQYLVASTE